jgi:hypothetical protein
MFIKRLKIVQVNGQEQFWKSPQAGQETHVAIPVSIYDKLEDQVNGLLPDLVEQWS